jgi:hypothetical protein
VGAKSDLRFHRRASQKAKRKAAARSTLIQEFQMANGKDQMANVKQFEICHLPFAI